MFLRLSHQKASKMVSTRFMKRIGRIYTFMIYEPYLWLTFLFLGAGISTTRCTPFACAEALRFAFADALQFCADPAAGAGVAGLLDKART